MARVVGAVLLAPTLAVVLVVSAAARRPALDLDRVDLLGLEVATGLALVGGAMLATGVRGRRAAAGGRTPLGWPTVAILGGSLALAVLATGLTLGGADVPDEVGRPGSTADGDDGGAVRGVLDLDAPPGGVSVGAVLVLALVVVAVAVAGMAWRRDRDEAPAEEVDLSPGDADRAARAGRAALDGVHGDDRRAVLDAFAAMERALGDVGLVRATSETQDELVGRALVAGGVPPDAVAELAAVYRVARWSAAPVTTDHRERARGALDEVLRGARR